MPLSESFILRYVGAWADLVTETKFRVIPSDNCYPIDILPDTEMRPTNLKSVFVTDHPRTDNQMFLNETNGTLPPSFRGGSSSSTISRSSSFGTPL